MPRPSLTSHLLVPRTLRLADASDEFEPQSKTLSPKPCASQTLAMNSNLRTINLASCNIGAAGALALWHYIKATRAPLEVVDIRDNNVGLGRVVEAMEQAVMQKPSIRAVGFDFSRDALIEASRLVAEVMSSLTPRLDVNLCC